MNLISDSELPKAELRAYSGNVTDVVYFIGGLVERGRVADAEQHAAALATMGYVEANAALGVYLYLAEDCPSAVEHLSPRERFQRYLALAAPYASSNRPGNVVAAFDIADALDSRERYKEAFPWFKRAAEAGHEEAAIALGYAFTQGLGVDVDVLEGARWFMRSLKMEPSESFSSDDTKWPVNRERGWVDWELFGELAGQLDSDARNELMRIVSGSGLGQNKADLEHPDRNAPDLH